MWLVAALAAQAHVPRSNVIEVVDQRSLATQSNTPWAVEPVGRDGLVVWTEDQGEMVARRYDTDLSLRWAVALPEIVDAPPVHTLARDGAAWAVFQSRALAVVTRIAVADGSLKTWLVPLEHRARRVVDFETVFDDVWLVMVDGRSSMGGKLRHLDLETGASSEVGLPGTPVAIELQRLTADPLRGVVDVSYRTLEQDRFTQHVAEARDGRVLNGLVLQVPDLNLLDIQRQSLADGTSLAVGTYADEPRGTRAQGFYAARYDDHGQLTYVATHSFTSFDHFFDDLPMGRRQLRRQQVAVRAQRGQDLDIDVRFATHDVQRHDGRIVLSGEIYTPRMGTGPRVVVVDVDGQNVVRTQSVGNSDGYWFLHAVTAAFDPDGSIAWDASLPLHNVADSHIVEHVQVGLHNDLATLAYSNGEQLVTRVFDGGRLLEDQAKRALVPYDRAAVRKQPMTVEPWFEASWLSYGPQRVRTGGRQFVIERLAAKRPGNEAPPEAEAAVILDGPPQATITPVH